MNLAKHLREIATFPYYRQRPMAALGFTYAKWLFAGNRVESPEEFLESLDISLPMAFAGYERWRPLLEDVVCRVAAKVGHQGGVSLQDGMILYAVVRALQPEYLIETGVAAGVSNSFINAALVENGHGVLYSIELPPGHSAGRIHDDGGVFAWPTTGVGWAVPPEIRHAIGGRNELILEDVRTALPRVLKRLPHLDLFFHDDLHTPEHMMWEYQLVWPRLRPGGILLSDDSDFAWIRFCRDHQLEQSSLNIQRLTAVRKGLF